MPRRQVVFMCAIYFHRFAIGNVRAVLVQRARAQRDDAFLGAPGGDLDFRGQFVAGPYRIEKLRTAASFLGFRKIFFIKRYTDYWIRIALIF